MRRDAYDQYVAAIESFRQEKKLTFNEAVLPEKQEEPEIVFVCKKYATEGGLSHFLHTSSNPLGQIKAILGKGLGIREEGGTHLAFTAGTGVLPFMDLVALMLRVNLGLLKPKGLSPIFQ